MATVASRVMPVAGVVARGAGETAVDHDAHAFDGERRLGDVGGEHDAAPARWRRGQGEILLLGGQRAGEQAHVDPGRDRRGEEVGGTGDLGDAGQEHEHVAGRRRAAPRSTALAAARSRRSVRWRGRQRISTGCSRPTLAGTGAGASSTASSRAKAAVSAVADIASMRRSGRSVAADVERQGEAEVGGEVPLVDLVEEDRPRRRAVRGRAGAGASALPR